MGTKVKMVLTATIEVTDSENGNGYKNDNDNDTAENIVHLRKRGRKWRLRKWASQTKWLREKIEILP